MIESCVEIECAQYLHRTKKGTANKNQLSASFHTRHNPRKQITSRYNTNKQRKVQKLKFPFIFRLHPNYTPLTHEVQKFTHN